MDTILQMADIKQDGLIFIDEDPIWKYSTKSQEFGYEVTLQLIRFGKGYICDMVLIDKHGNKYHYRNEREKPQEKVLKDLIKNYARLKRLKEVEDFPDAIEPIF